jgi:hypothetical protein
MQPFRCGGDIAASYMKKSTMQIQSHENMLLEIFIRDIDISISRVAFYFHSAIRIRINRPAGFHFKQVDKVSDYRFALYNYDRRLFSLI